MGGLSGLGLSGRGCVGGTEWAGLSGLGLSGRG